MNHYRCHCVYVTKKEERATQILLVFPTKYSTPLQFILRMSSLRRTNYLMLWIAQHPKRHFPTSETTKWLQLRNYQIYFLRWHIIFSKDQTLCTRNQWKIRHCTSESASKYDQTSYLITAQYHRRWLWAVLYKFSAQGTHVPFSSTHCSPWSPCPTTKCEDRATSKGGNGRAKFQLEIKRQEKSHSPLCIDSTIPESS